MRLEELALKTAIAIFVVGQVAGLAAEERPETPQSNEVRVRGLVVGKWRSEFSTAGSDEPRAFERWRLLVLESERVFRFDCGTVEIDRGEPRPLGPDEDRPPAEVCREARLDESIYVVGRFPDSGAICPGGVCALVALEFPER